jgi:hypothetical protein
MDSGKWMATGDSLPRLWRGEAHTPQEAVNLPMPEMPLPKSRSAVGLEFGAAGGIKVVHVQPQARLDAGDIRDVGAAETERIARAGGSLLRRSLRRGYRYTKP